MSENTNATPTEQKETTQFGFFGDDLGATLCIPLYARAKINQFYDRPEWKDKHSEQAWKQLEQYGEKHQLEVEKFCLTSQDVMVGSIVRSETFDLVTKCFLEQYPEGQVVTIGAGLCTRPWRLDSSLASTEQAIPEDQTPSTARWIGLDRQAVIEIRKRVFSDDPMYLVSGDMLQKEWLHQLDLSRPALFIFEGILMFLTEKDVAQVMNLLAQEMQAPFYFAADIHHLSVSGTAENPREVNVTKVTGSTFRFGIKDVTSLVRLAQGYRLFNEYDLVSDISPSAAEQQEKFRALTNSHLYSLIVLEHTPQPA